MSFEVYLQCFNVGQPAGVRRADVRCLFPVVETESELDYWHVRYDEQNTCCISVSALPADPDALASLCVFRPCGDHRLWEGLITTMRLGNVVLYFPGSRRPIVAAVTAVAHLPADLVVSLGLPLVVSTAAQILEEVSK